MAFNPVQSLRTAMKNSPWVVISVAFHVALAAVIAYFTIRHALEKQPEAVSVSVRERPPEREIELPPELLDRKAVPKNEEAEVVTFEEDTYVPTTEEPEDLHLDRGDPNAADNLPPGATGGTSIGAGLGPGHYSTGGPSAFATRRPGGGNHGRGGGATQGTEKAVLEGLRWLVRHQNPDGSWSPATLRERCGEKRQCVGPDEEFTNHLDVGLTSLALLAFLGAGYSNDSKQSIVDTAMGKKYMIGEVVKNGLKWLKDRQEERDGSNEEGAFSTPRAYMYNEALATLAMCEAYGLSGNKTWRGPAQKGVKFLIASQRISPINSTSMGGWRYCSNADIQSRKDSAKIDEASSRLEARDGDSSVTAWVVMALKSAQLVGLEVPKESMDGAFDFISWLTLENGQVGYVSADQAGMEPTGLGAEAYDHHPAVYSALGMLTRTFVKHDINDPMLEKGAALLMKDLPRFEKGNTESVDYYYWYYGSLALNQFDGPDSPRAGKNKYWEPWNKAIAEENRGVIIKMQDDNQERDVCSRGGWLLPDRWSYADATGPIYPTAINVLTLEVYYRYGNAFTGTEKEAAKKIGGAKKNEAKPEPAKEEEKKEGQ